MISHRTLSIIGDSIGLQIFHSLESELLTFMSNDPTKTMNGNGTHTYFETYRRGDKVWPILFEPPEYTAAIRWLGILYLLFLLF